MPKSPDQDDRQKEILAQFFKKISGDDMEVDAFELQEVLTYILKKGEICKRLVIEKLSTACCKRSWSIVLLGKVNSLTIYSE